MIIISGCPWSLCSSLGLDVLLVDLKEPCSYIEASTLVPFYLGVGLHWAASLLEKQIIFLHKLDCTIETGPSERFHWCRYSIWLC